MRIDEFFEKQPTPRFQELLNAPRHTKPPKIFGKRQAEQGETSAHGAYFAECCEDFREALLTAMEDMDAFLGSVGEGGDSYPIRIMRADGFSEESYGISVGEDGCTVYSSDPEGARRAIYYLEEEMIKREGAFLPLGDIRRDAAITRRITRGFFSPTNRAPKWGDELLDDVDYYSDGYLSRLAAAGTNGLWIYTSFAQLVNSPYVTQKDENCERRMEKLARVVAKCKRYGVRVYIFAIEPHGLTRDELEGNRHLLGAAPTGRYPLCPRIDEVREHVLYCTEYIFRTIPDLAGFIDITTGERPTTCASIGTYKSCPRCGKFSRGENLAYSVDLIKEGIRRAGTGAEFISWTYGHKFWAEDDILEYVEKMPSDVITMQNFEELGINRQLGKPRLACDYWLSYVGPSDLFSMTARVAKKAGKRIYAKMQVCSSHEISTVPYIPAPGILFDKYGAARELGVTGIMECWYFGNYPSLMNRASTELSYIESFEDKHAFLVELASRLYGRSRAEEVASAWEAFEEGYLNYPTNIMFSYYGPMHDSVVWELSPIPKNLPLSRTWMLLDRPDGDRIGECLFKGHTLDEVITLSERMCEGWSKGISLLPLDVDDEHMTCVRATGLLFESGKNILKFYKLREMLGCGVGDPWATVSEMEGIAAVEIDRSREMAELCLRDPRLGYHSEAEGFKFFPEKLESRARQLEGLFETDFKEIRARLMNMEKPLAYYYAEGREAYPLGDSAESYERVSIDSEREFGVYIDGDELKIPIKCRESDGFSVCFEFELFHPESTVCYIPKGKKLTNVEGAPLEAEGLMLGQFVLSHQSVWGDGIAKVLSDYSIDSRFDDGRAEHILSVKIPREKWDGERAIKLNIKIGGKLWKRDPEEVITLGKGDLSPENFGFLLPISK